MFERSGCIKMEKIKSLLNQGTPLALLLVRLSVGIIFIQSGYAKLTHLSGTTDFFTQLHIPFPAANALIASSTEFFGGILILVGFLTQWVALPMAFVMVIAILTAQLPQIKGLDELVGLQEWDYLLFFVLLFFIGAGRISLDGWFSRKK